MDVLSSAFVEELVAAIRYWSGGALDTLIYTVGTQVPVGLFSETDSDQWEASIATNLIGAARSTRACIPYLRKSSDGRILLFSGGGAFYPRPNFSAYAASKAGLVSFGSTLAAELTRSGISVNCISPGYIPTLIHEPVRAAGLPLPDVNGDGLNRAVSCILHMLSENAKGLTGKVVSALFDEWWTITPERVDELNRSSLWTTMRVNKESLT